MLRPLHNPIWDPIRAFCDGLMLIYLILLPLFLFAAPLPNLEQQPQEFILETKQISIPGFPYAFNPSIIRWQGKILMSFRIIPGNKKSFNSEIALLFLDENFDPISEPQLLCFRKPDSPVPCRAEDGRLVQVGSSLYLIYSDCVQPKISKEGFRLQVAELIYENGQFQVLDPEPLTQFEGESPNHREKNWVPFDYSGSLYLAYSLNPHLIFEPIRHTGSCRTIATSSCDPFWRWGRPCGGTPAILVDGQYLSFLHSWTNMASIHSDGETIAHYFMSAYTFEPHPPFSILKTSPEPIIAPGFYSGKTYPYYWKPVLAIFPCGLIADGPYLYVAYGRADRETWVMKIDKEKLLQSLR